MNEPDEDPERHESKRLRLVDGMDVSTDTKLDVSTCGEMNATTTHEPIARTRRRHPDPNNDKSKADSIQQWKANLMPLEIVYDTMASKFMDPSKVEKRQLREVSWANKHKTHELVNGDDARGSHQVHAKWVPTSRGIKVRSGLGKTQFAVSVEPRAMQSVPLHDSLNTADGDAFAVHCCTHASRFAPVRQSSDGYSSSSQSMEWTVKSQVARRPCDHHGSIANV